MSGTLSFPFKSAS
jgi:hypothetical protein